APAGFAGGALGVGGLGMIRVECIAGGSRPGPGGEQSRATGGICGIPRPAGLREGDRLAEPIFTPTTKATGAHDEPMTYDQVVDVVGPDTAAQLRRITLDVYRPGAAPAAQRGGVLRHAQPQFRR